MSGHAMVSAIEPGDAELLDAASSCPELPDLESLTDAALRDLTRRRGVAWSTAKLYARLLGDARHRAVNDAVRARLRPWREHARVAGPRLLVVPGAFHVEHPRFHGDGKLIHDAASALGVESRTIPCPGGGSLATNSKLIARELASAGRDPVVLVSLSKGAADVRAVAERPDAAELFANVKAWLDISGIAFGTPIATRIAGSRPLSLLARGVCWWRGHEFQLVRDLAVTPDRPFTHARRAAPHLRIVHVVGFPLTHHLSTPLARKHHRRMSAHGPNDACTMLAPIAHDAGETIPVWGVDHYMQPRWDIRDLAAALISHVLEDAARDRR